MADKNWIEESADWVGTNINTNIRDAIPETKADIIDTVMPVAKKLNLKPETVSQMLPVGAAAITGGALLLMNESISKASKFIFKGARKLITGFGTFEKLPVIGGLFKTVGSFVEGMGDYAGFGVAAAGAFVAHQIFTPKTSFIHKGSVEKDTGVSEAHVHNEKVTLSSKKMPGKDVTAPVPAPADLKLEAKAEKEDALKKTGPEAEGLSYAQKREKRLEFMHDEGLVAAYGTLMRHDNQLFENRMEFIKQANEFEKSKDRKEFVTRLEKIGVESSEADNMVVKAPKFQNKSHQDPQAHTKLPDMLEKLGKEFDTDYGKHDEAGSRAWVWNMQSRKNPNWKEGMPERDKSNRYKWDDLRVTEKVEYLQHSIHYMKAALNGYKSYANGTGGWASGYHYIYKMSSGSMWKEDPIVVYSGTQLPGGHDTYTKIEHMRLMRWDGHLLHSGSRWKGLIKSNDTQGELGEAQYIKLRPEDTHVYNNLCKSAEEKGIDLTFASGINGIDKNIDTYSKLLDEYRAVLEKSEKEHSGEIATYKREYLSQKQTFHLIAKHDIAITSIKENNGEITMDIRDISNVNPDARKKGDTQKWTWSGKRTGDSITITKTKNHTTSEEITLNPPHIISLPQFSEPGWDKDGNQVDGKLIKEAEGFGELIETMRKLKAEPVKKAALTKPLNPLEDIMSDISNTEHFAITASQTPALTISKEKSAQA